MIKIGHASSDENGRASNGKAGDQTGGEVCIRQWYSSPWDLVLRCKDAAKAELMAKACEAACNNRKIGYDQYQRNTLLPQAKACNWKLDRITVACECDCSSLMTVCAQCAGIDVPYISGNAPYTGIMRTQFMKTGMFEALSESKYLTSDKYLKRGDILVRTSGHTAMALENGGQSSTTSTTVSSGKIDTVLEVQKWLNSSYAAGLVTDGIYGANTKKALIKALQKEIGVSVDGIFGTKTASAIRIMFLPADALKKGSTGKLVKILQALLVCNGQKTAYVDGDFGSGTEAAVKAIQKKFNLTVDGEAGKNTFKALCS